MRFLIAAALVAALPVLAQTPTLVDKADRELKALEYQAAVKSLEAALARPDNDRASMLRIFELQGIALATLGQEAKALRAFQSLLSLNPDYRLEGNHPPRVTTAVVEARGWVGQNGSIATQPSDPQVGGGQVKSVKLELKNDPLKLVKEVRFHLNIGGKDSVVDVAVAAAAAAAPVGAPRVTWWAELLGERKAVLQNAIAPVSPRTEVAPDAPVAQADPTPAPAPELTPPPAPPPEVVAKPGPPIPGTRVAGVAIVLLGAAAAGVGVGFGVASNATAARLTGAEKDATGRVIGLTQREAAGLIDQQRTEATAANVMIIAGSALAATGAVIFIISLTGPSESSQVSLAPAGPGAVLTGSF